MLMALSRAIDVSLLVDLVSSVSLLGDLLIAESVVEENLNGVSVISGNSCRDELSVFSV